MTEKTNDQALDYQIENVLGIERAELTLRPGINVLRGRNAAGKTSAMRAIVRAQGGGGDLEKRDGSERGRVVGPGVTLSVRKVVTTKGEADVSLAETAPLSTLIDPGLKDTDAAARARIRALLQLLDVPVTDESIGILCQASPDLQHWLENEVRIDEVPDLLTAAEKLRGKAHSEARRFEEVAQQAVGETRAAQERAQALLEEIGGAEKVVDLSVDDAKSAVIEGAKRYERESARCESRERLEAEQAELRDTLGVKPDPTPAKDEANRTALKAAELKVEIEKLSKQIASMDAERKGLIEASKAASARQDELIAAAKKWDAAQEIIQRQPEGPTRAELEQLKADLLNLPQTQLEIAQQSERYKEERKLQEDAARAQKEAAERGAFYRSFASGIPDRLGKILAEAGAEGLTVMDGRLHAIVDGKPVDWERRLSDGQRISLALKLMSNVSEGVVALSDSFWMALDPKNQKQFAKEAKEHGLYVLTEQPAEGELRVEHEA